MVQFVQFLQPDLMFLLNQANEPFHVETKYLRYAHLHGSAAFEDDRARRDALLAVGERI